MNTFKPHIHVTHTVLHIIIEIAGEYNGLDFINCKEHRFVWEHTLSALKVRTCYICNMAGMICLICMHEHEGVQQPRMSTDISGKSQLHMLHIIMLCETAVILKICRSLTTNCSVLYTVDKDVRFDYDI